MKTIKLFLLIIFALTTYSFAQQKIFVAHIDGEIDMSIAPYIRRVVKAAEDADAKAINIAMRALFRKEFHQIMRDPKSRCCNADKRCNYQYGYFDNCIYKQPGCFSRSTNCFVMQQNLYG